MVKSPNVGDMLDSVDAPITSSFERVYDCRTQNLYGVRTNLLINSLDLGVLSESDYQQVAERSKRGLILLSKAMDFAKEYLASHHDDISWISLKCPLTFLTKTNPVDMIFKAFGEGFDCSRICLEFSSQILFELTPEIISTLDSLKALHIKIMIRDFGDGLCPVLKLMSYKFDYVCLHPLVVEMLSSKQTASAGADLVGFINSLGLKVIAPSLTQEDDLNAYFKSGCDGFTYADFRFSPFDEVNL